MAKTTTFQSASTDSAAATSGSIAQLSAQVQFLQETYGTQGYSKGVVGQDQGVVLKVHRDSRGGKAKVFPEYRGFKDGKAPQIPVQLHFME